MAKLPNPTILYFQKKILFLDDNTCYDVCHAYQYYIKRVRNSFITCECQVYNKCANWKNNFVVLVTF